MILLWIYCLLSCFCIVSFMTFLKWFFLTSGDAEESSLNPFFSAIERSSFKCLSTYQRKSINQTIISHVNLKYLQQHYPFYCIQRHNWWDTANSFPQTYILYRIYQSFPIKINVIWYSNKQKSIMKCKRGVWFFYEWFLYLCTEQRTWGWTLFDSLCGKKFVKKTDKDFSIWKDVQKRNVCSFFKEDVCLEDVAQPLPGLLLFVLNDISNLVFRQEIAHFCVVLVCLRCLMLFLIFCDFLWFFSYFLLLAARNTLLSSLPFLFFCVCF